MFDSCHSHEFSTIDSNSKHVVDVKNWDTVEKYVGMVCIVSTIDGQSELFCESNTVLKYITLYTGYNTPSRSLLYSRCCSLCYKSYNVIMY